jgi:uncharacterized protein (DUF1778 family)
MIERTMVSLQMTVQEKEAIKAAANKENRSMSNYLLNAALTRAQEMYDIVPQYTDEEILELS